MTQQEDPQQVRCQGILRFIANIQALRENIEALTRIRAERASQIMREFILPTSVEIQNHLFLKC